MPGINKQRPTVAYDSTDSLLAIVKGSKNMIHGH